MAATKRQEKELKEKMEKIKKDPNVKPLDKLRAYVMSKGVSNFKSMARRFRWIDLDGNGSIDYGEFKQALHKNGIEAADEMTRSVFDDMDMDKTGKLSLDEFFVALRPPMNDRRIGLVRQAFNKLDKSGNNVITADDLKGIYSAVKHPKYLSGEWTENQVFEEWLNSFNGDDVNDGVVSEDDFFNYYSGVSASIDADVYFDLMMRQAWKL